jgi:hypothetical protein
VTRRRPATSAALLAVPVALYTPLLAVSGRGDAAMEVGAQYVQECVFALDICVAVPLLLARYAPVTGRARACSSSASPGLITFRFVVSSGAADVGSTFSFVYYVLGALTLYLGVQALRQGGDNGKGADALPAVKLVDATRGALPGGCRPIPARGDRDTTCCT